MYELVSFCYVLFVIFVPSDELLLALGNNRKTNEHHGLEPNQTMTYDLIESVPQDPLAQVGL